MDRRAFLREGGSIGLTSGIAGCVSNPFAKQESKNTPIELPTSRETYQNPVFEPILADPSAIRTPDGTYFAYGTEDNWHDGEGFRVAPIVKSDDLVTWEYVGEVFETKPDWKDEGFVWAPDVHRFNGKYYLYYSFSAWGDPNPGIGVATADSPEGPYTDHGKLFSSKEINVQNSIDPMLFVDDGTPYLFWGSFHGIYAIQLSTDGFETVGEKTKIAGQFYEASYVIKRDGTYYYFGSSGSCCEGSLSTYQVSVGRSESVLGPYKTPEGDTLLEFQGRLVLDDGNGFVAPGHNAIVTDDDGNDWTLYHAYEKPSFYIQDTPRRPLMLDPILWEDGWPTVKNQKPSKKAPVPVIKK